MGSQLLVGGKKVEDTPAFHRAVQVEHERIREEYESRVADLERERHALGEDRAQIDRYKQLLLKQRDIMIALTGRLNERDASILALQEELDAYDSHQRMMEDALDNKTAMLIRLQQGTPGGPDADGNMGGGGGGGGGMGMGMDAARTYEPEIDGPEAQVVFEGGRGTPSNGGPKLSAHEKVSELGGLLATSRGDVEAISRELEDLRAEKVSLEYLLRERLEKVECFGVFLFFFCFLLFFVFCFVFFFFFFSFPRAHNPCSITLRWSRPKSGSGSRPTRRTLAAGPPRAAKIFGTKLRGSGTISPRHRHRSTPFATAPAATRPRAPQDSMRRCRYASFFF
jgi:hypothetical protein